MVENDTSSVEYQLSTSTGPFDIPFYFIENGHISAWLYTANSDGSYDETTLSLDTDYTLTGAGDSDGGTLTLTEAHDGAILLIARTPDATQLTSYVATGKFPATSHERALDKLTMLIQQIYWWWDDLPLKRPNIFANFYHAKNRFIKYLKNPVDEQDAATKNYTDGLYDGAISHADAQFKRTLRVPESSVNILPSAPNRAWMGLGFDGAGQPKLQDPAGTGLWGYVPAIGSFEKGSLLTQRFEVLLWESTDEYWRWDGAMPKIVLPGSTPDTAGGRGKGKWLDVTDATLRSNLGSDEGQLLIGAPANIEALRGILTTGTGRITTRGALSAGDGGSGTWIFESSDLSSQVSSYPRLFIAPVYDPTGASGAWRLDISDCIHAVQYGVGLMALDTSVDISDLTQPSEPEDTSDTDAMTAYYLQMGQYNAAVFTRQAAEAAAFNKEVLDQIVLWANSQYLIYLPPLPIYITYLRYDGVAPKFKGSFGTNRNNGTMFLTTDALSTEPVIKVTSPTDSEDSRLSGLFMEDIFTASMDFFSVPNYDTFTDNRSARTCYDFNFSGTQIHLDRLYAGGFKRGIINNELWDGYLGEVRLLYCSDPNGSVPAAFIGTIDGDNSNNLQIDHLHIEFSPYSLELGFCEHVTFNVVKCESWRKLDATNYVVKIQAEATKVKINSLHVTTQNSTKTHAIYDAGQFTEINTLWCAGGQSADYPYAGIHWYYGVATNNSKKVIKNAHMNRMYAADGSDPSDYPVILANYQRFDGTLRLSDSYETSLGTITNVKTGLVAVGTQCIVHDVDLIVGAGDKSAGPVFYFKGDGANVENITQTAGNVIYRLAGGNVANNRIGGWGSQFQNTSSGTIYTYGKRTVFLSAATAVSQIYGMVGDIITIVSRVSGSTLVYDASKIVTDGAATIIMTAGKPYQFLMEESGKAVQI